MLVKTPSNSHFFFFSFSLLFPFIDVEIVLQSMARIHMPALFPSAVHVQQSKKQQVSKCCVLSYTKRKASWRTMRKKYDENWNMDVGLQKRVPHKI